MSVVRYIYIYVWLVIQVVVELCKLSTVNIVNSLPIATAYALIYLAFSWLSKEKVKGLLQLERVMVYAKV